MASKNYYGLLGLDSTATPEEIKKAYRRLALRYHPDHNKGDRRSEEKFKDISEAYGVLRDPRKRARYDMYGIGPRAAAWPSGGPTPPPEDIPHSRVDDDTAEADLFSKLFRSKSHRARPARGRGGDELRAITAITLEEAFRGTTRLIKPNGETIRFTINPGIADGQVLRLPGVGGHGGDVLITVTVEHHPVFERMGNDLYCTVTVPLYTAVLGGKVPLRTFHGMINVDITPGTRPDATLRLASMGMPLYGRGSGFGDCFVRLQIDIPSNLTEEEIILFRRLRSLRDS